MAGRQLGLPDLISFDMGGTTAKASVIAGAEVAVTAEYEVGGARRLIMRVLSAIVKRSGGVRIHDTTSGFRCIAQPLLGKRLGARQHVLEGQGHWWMLGDAPAGAAMLQRFWKEAN